MVANNTSTHFVIFPFMAKGHTLPLLYLARLLSHRHVPVTVITTPANSTYIKTTLDDPKISVVELPFPEIPNIPPGVESSDTLPSMSLYFDFLTSTKLMKPLFEKALEDLEPAPTCIVSDTFVGWTQECAEKAGIPRLAFFGMSSFAMLMYTILGHQRPHALTTSPDQPFQMGSEFPRLSLTRNDFDPPFNDLEPKGPMTDFMAEQIFAMSRSYGVIVNSFDGLEASYTDYWNRCYGPKAICVGPLCLGKPVNEPRSTNKILSDLPRWRSWLDRKLEAGAAVMYVSFGTQADLSPEQLSAIAEGLERSGANFLWVTKPKILEMLRSNGYFNNINNDDCKSMVIGEWVDQVEILEHDGITGFLSHCGWNSVTESICAGVPMLALPLMAEQHLNARLIAEEVGGGIRIWPENGSARGFVAAADVEKGVRELMEGVKGEEVRKKMNEVGRNARAAMQEGGGSSCKALDKLILDVSNYHAI